MAWTWNSAQDVKKYGNTTGSDQKSTLSGDKRMGLVSILTDITTSKHGYVMALLMVLLFAFLMSLVVYLTGLGVFPGFLAVGAITLLVLGCCFVMLPDDWQRYLRQRIGDAMVHHKRVCLLKANWTKPADECAISAAYRLASEEGHLHSFQVRMARREPDTMTLGDTWSALELSRVDAGLKSYPEQRIFRAFNTMKA